MAVKIRLKQTGKKNRRTYRVVVIDEHKKRDGKVVENLGFINPLVKPTQVEINQDRLAFWREKGATVTAAVLKYKPT